MKLLYGIVVFLSLVILLAVCVMALWITTIGAADPAPINVIHSGIGTALCTPSTVCTS